MKIIVVTPVYNDWDSLNVLLDKIILTYPQYDFSFIVVNDCSTVEMGTLNQATCCINLNQNLGHQRAIAIGLCYIHENLKAFDNVVIMDSDGEDRPEDIGKLIEKSTKHKSIVFAQRTRRREGILFKLLYIIYKTLFLGLVGKTINFGNYSVIPKKMLPRVISKSEIWNHYSGAIIKSKLNYQRQPCERGDRYFGKSKMNLVSLVIHGLSAISIQLEVVAVRIMLASALTGFLIFIMIVTIFILRLFTDLFVPGWSSTALILLILVFAAIFGISLLLSLSVLISRNSIQLPPLKYYKEFILDIKSN